ncbi:hypothetical protein BD410DRAFT_746660 [Rickenella mellea]|uniref:VPS9 domain-containing protein n=1 Tax=Rickenella mellea TaxID=50990 RepID=A0A4Y7QAC3_9AGAM|nr:hypothetical protein BD410DRAFT_746660 [Rickenella mellea]
MTTKLDSSPQSSLRGSDNHSSHSHEVLTAHPLLSPGPASPTHPGPSPELNSGSQSQTNPPKYVPYTPRQRIPIGSATIGTTVHAPVSVSPQPRQGGATSKLQLQNLKAAAQTIGLDVGSLGWVMLEELALGHDHGAEWNEIWSSITTGKATLLLPLEPATTQIITLDFLKDHIVFCNGSARNKAPLVTLSGLRGHIIDQDLTIISTLYPSSKAFQLITAPATRPSSLLSLPPLPIPLGSNSVYPKYALPGYSPSLPLLPRHSVPLKPPLPPRPGARSATPTGSRIVNPFASLFSKTPSPVPLAPAATIDPPLVDHVVEVSAFAIDRHINRREVAKVLTKAIKTEIKDSLAGIPPWVVDRVQSFSINLHPMPKTSKRARSEVVPSDASYAYSVSTIDEPPDEMERTFQSFYSSLEEDLNSSSGGSPTLLRKRDERNAEDDNERKKGISDKDEHEARNRQILEKVERTICSLFYDRLFRQANSDDGSHDEALSSRVAALNMLDLTLEHLGVDVGIAGPDVERVVTACGQTISQLEFTRCPADKAAVLVAAHRVIVDGLQRLPPVRIKADELIDNQKTPKAISFNRPASLQDVEEPSKAEEPPSSSISDAVPAGLPEVSTAVVTTAVPEIVLTTQGDASSETKKGGSANEEITPSEPLPVSEKAVLTISPPSSPTQVSGDVLLPLIIFSVVKANPSQLVSHLLYTQRFRDQSVGGEESYCLINLMAVVEFLENVDLGALGLKESENKVMSTADLAPIPLAHVPLGSDKVESGAAGIRGRVGQQVDAITGSANKVISGVVDSSFGVLRALLPTNSEASSEPLAQSAPWNTPRPGFGLLRRESVFSIASLAASLPGGRERAKSFASQRGEDGQEMVESRPGSIMGVYVDDDSSSERSENGDASESEDEDDDEGAAHDAKSIRSFESMMSGRRRERLSLTDRLANMSRLTRAPHSPPSRERHLESTSHSRLSSSHPGTSLPEPNRFDTPSSSRAPSPTPRHESKATIPPPNRRFLECSIDDIKVSEVETLLLEYRKLVESVRSIGVFHE